MNLTVSSGQALLLHSSSLAISVLCFMKMLSSIIRHLALFALCCSLWLLAMLCACLLCSLWQLAMFVCLYFGLLALGCLLLFEDAAVYFKKHCTNKHKRNLPSHVTTVNTNTGALPLQTNARGRQHEAQIPHTFTAPLPSSWSVRQCRQSICFLGP